LLKLSLLGATSTIIWAQGKNHCPQKSEGLLQGQKTDANDALAMQLGVRFCPVKEVDQQSLQTLETSRKFLSRDQVALGNHIRAYLYAYGVTITKGKST
jgi:transposase